MLITPKPRTFFNWGRKPTLSYIDRYSSGSVSGRSSWTFTGVNIGTAADDRIVYAVVHIVITGGTTPGVITSATINGVTANIEAAPIQPEVYICTQLVWARVPSGTTGVSISVVTSAPSAIRFAADVYVAYKTRNPSPFSYQVSTGASSSFDFDVPCPSDGFIIYGHASGDLSPSVSGVTQQVTGNIGGSSYAASGMAQPTARSANRAVSIGGGATGHQAIVASFR